MIGGPPIAQPYSPYQYPAPVYVPPPAYGQQPPAARPTQPWPPPSQQAALPRMPAPPVVRGQMPDEPPARPGDPASLGTPKLDMPPPEALGVKMPAAPPDWTDLRVRLNRIGATGFALDPLPEGGYRFRCQVPTAGGQPRTIESRAATEAAAVRRALDGVGR